MQTVNRKIQPLFKQIETIDIIKARKQQLTNSIPVYTIKAGTQEVVRVDLIFDAGSWYQPQPLVASATNAMLLEGTSTYSAAQIAEKFDFYGAFINTETDNHNGTITLFTLKKYLPHTLELIEDILKNAMFADNEFSTYISKRRQRYIVNRDKVKNMARDNFLKAIFGNEHPYGKRRHESDFENVTPEKIREFYHQFYVSSNCRIVVAGNIDSNVVSLLDKHLGENDWNSHNPPKITEIPIENSAEKFHYQHKKDALQSAIRVGKPLINRLHPDYLKIKIINTILGGYFGSRLMMNIREDKGYTYGIYSLLVSQRTAGYFSVVSEVGKDVCRPARDEIFNELKRLRTEPVPNEELDVVRNYILGELLRTFDGPFALSESFQTILEYGLGYDYFERFIQAIRTITPEEIQALSEKYLHEDTMYQSIAGFFE